MTSSLKVLWMFWCRWLADLAPAPRGGLALHVIGVLFVDLPPYTMPIAPPFPLAARNEDCLLHSPLVKNRTSPA